jgi:bifunctional non-homologous end joining protein LigD
MPLFLIDGEVVVCGEDGIAVFDRLRSGAQRKPEALLYAFDLIEVDGRDLRREPIEGRKERLRQMLDVPMPCRGMLLCEHIKGDGPLIFEHVCALGCEGIVSKRRGSRSRSGRSPDWVKTKNPSSAAARRLVEEDWTR